MKSLTREVVARSLPEVSGASQTKAFLRELSESLAGAIRPRVVLNCAGVRKVDGELVYLLLCCLETVMKRNGDVRLAAIPDRMRPALELYGMHRLFRFYASTEEAIESFRRPAAFSAALAAAPDLTNHSSAQAA